jgi:NitT/TauT family transport system substrate-binding protein
MMRRRHFLAGAAAGTGTLLGLPARPASAEPPPETTRLRLAFADSICQAPQHVADPLLTAEGFNDVKHVQSPVPVARRIATGEADLTMTFAGPVLLRIDAGDPVLLLGGGHIGCLEIVANDRIRAVRDLKGKRVLTYAREGPGHILLAIALAHLGMDHRRDIDLVVRRPADTVAAFEAGEVDAVVVTPPVAQEMRSKKIGHVILDTTKDRPWSHYFCCILIGNRDWVRRHPVATKRAMRAILKSTDLCAAEPDRTARALIDRGFAKRYDYALQAMTELPYRAWRDYDPVDTVRFYALRLHEAGMVKSSPQTLLAQGADWRFLNELKKELKS